MGLTKEVSLNEFAGELEKYARESTRAFKEAVTSGVYRSVNDVVRASPVDTGLYASSWDVISSELAVIIGNYAPHAPIIEIGARKFSPPIAPLRAWAKRVLGDPSQPPDYSPEVRRLAYFTWKKINDIGIKPRFILQKAVPTIIKNIREELRKRFE